MRLAGRGSSWADVGWSCGGERGREAGGDKDGLETGGHCKAHCSNLLPWQESDCSFFPSTSGLKGEPSFVISLPQHRAVHFTIMAEAVSSIGSRFPLWPALTVELYTLTSTALPTDLRSLP